MNSDKKIITTAHLNSLSTEEKIKYLSEGYKVVDKMPKEAPIEYYKYKSFYKDEDEDEVIGYRFLDYNEWREYLKNNPSELEKELECVWIGLEERDEPTTEIKETFIKKKSGKRDKPMEKNNEKQKAKHGTSDETACRAVVNKNGKNIRCIWRCGKGNSLCNRHLKIREDNEEEKFKTIDQLEDDEWEYNTLSPLHPNFKPMEIEIEEEEKIEEVKEEEVKEKPKPKKTRKKKGE